MWEPQVEALSKTYRLLRYDMRGHGGTEGTPGDYSLSLLSGDVVALLDELSIGRVHLVGCSLGAMVAQFMGVHHSSRLLSLSLCATSSEAPRPVWEARVASVRASGDAAASGADDRSLVHAGIPRRSSRDDEQDA